MSIFDTAKVYFSSIIDKAANIIAPATPPDKKSIVQGYEENRAFVDWDSHLKNDYIIPFSEYVKTYKQHSTVYAAIQFLMDNILGEGYAFFPRDGIKNPSQLQKEQLEYIFDNPDPDGNLTFSDIMYSSGTDCLRDGMKMIQIDSGGYPYLYDTLETATLRPRINKNGLFKNDGVGHWEQIIQGKTAATFQKEDLIWLKLQDRTDLIFPQSPLLALMMDIESDLIAKEFNRLRFENNAYVGLVIKLPEDATQEEARGMLDFIRDKYKSKAFDFGRTRNRAYKPLVLYGGADIDAGIIDSYKDMNFIKLREITNESVCMVFKIPPSFFFGNKGFSIADADSAKLNRFYKATIYPLQKLFEDQIQKQFVERKLKATDWVFRFNRPVAVDKRSAVDNRSKLIKDGVMTPLEARTGLRVYFPEMLQENDQFISNEPAKQQSPKFNMQNEEPKREDDRSKMKNKMLPGPDHSEKKKREKKKLKDFDVKMVNKDLDNTENNLQTDMVKTLDKMKKSAMKKLPGLVADKKLSDIVNYKLPYKNEINNSINNNGKEIFNQGRKFVKQELKKAGKAATNLSDYERFVTMQATISGDDYTLTIEGKIKKAISVAISKKATSENQIIGIIEEIFSKEVFGVSTTARTLTTNFYNLGIDRQIQENKDFVPKVQYQTIDDDRRSDRCSELDGIVVSVDSDLYEKCRPPQHFNCRSLYVVLTTIDIELDPDNYGKDTPRKEINQILANTPGFQEV